jgi:hypothetical protein
MACFVQPLLQAGRLNIQAGGGHRVAERPAAAPLCQKVLRKGIVEGVVID